MAMRSRTPRRRWGLGDTARISLGVAAATLVGVLVGRFIERRRVLESAAQIALTDPLTGLANRRAWEEELRREVARARRNSHRLALVMLDLDHFKQYNDSFGHPAGDLVLHGAGAILRTAIRSHDVVARYGGEEFAVLLPATDAIEALEVAERLRSAIASRPWSHRKVTASLGVATTGPTTPSAAALVDQADYALYSSKQAGRNRIAHYNDCNDCAVDANVPAAQAM
jgi:diguanylate cyclase (GGDEF)-like protein